MKSVNKVILLGNLTRDPEMHSTENKKPACAFGLATNRSWVPYDSEQKSAATACARDIPLEIGVIGVKGIAFSYDYYEDSSIDGDPSDVEYVFQFAPNWAVDPSRLRVNTLDSLVYGLIFARWSGHLSSSQSCASPVLVYADKLAVILTGGPKHWQYSFWLWYK